MDPGVSSVEEVISELWRDKASSVVDSIGELLGQDKLISQSVRNIREREGSEIILLSGLEPEIHSE